MKIRKMTEDEAAELFHQLSKVFGQLPVFAGHRLIGVDGTQDEEGTELQILLTLVPRQKVKAD